MHGNVHEWCHDGEGELGSLRGGAADYTARPTALRVRKPESFKDFIQRFGGGDMVYHYGFRVARNASP